MKKKRCMGIILAVALLMTACNGKSTDTEAGNSEGVGIVDTEGVTGETENVGVEETTETTESTEDSETTESTEAAENTEGVGTNPTEDTTATGNGETGGNSTTGGNTGTGGNNAGGNNAANGGGNTGAGNGNGGGSSSSDYVFVRGQALADAIALAEADGQALHTLVDNGTDTIYFQHVTSPYGDGTSLTSDKISELGSAAFQILLDRGYEPQSMEISRGEIIKKYPLGDREVPLYRYTYKGTEFRETIPETVVISMEEGISRAIADGYVLHQIIDNGSDTLTYYYILDTRTGEGSCDLTDQCYDILRQERGYENISYSTILIKEYDSCHLIQQTLQGS